MAEVIAITSPHVRAEVRAEGGIVWRPRFRLGAREVEPLAVAPWSNDADPVTRESGLSPYLRWLGGAFLCLPFGGRAVPTGHGWPEAAGVAPLHGPAANAVWTVAEHALDRVTLSLAFDQPEVVERIEQTIACATDRACLAVSVSVHARRAGAVSAAYHPILRLPERPGGLGLDCDFAVGHTYPLPTFDNGCARYASTFYALNRVPRREGGDIDFSTLPFASPVEEIVLLGRARGRVRVHYRDEGFGLHVDWDSAVLPSCQLWLHDRAAVEHPFHGRFRGLGVEPCAGAFDLAETVSVAPNPLTATGEVTAIALSPARPTRFSVALTVEERA